jgi:hypothetical protein
MLGDGSNMGVFSEVASARPQDSTHGRWLFRFAFA